MEPISLSIMIAAAGEVVNSLLADRGKKLVEEFFTGIIGNRADGLICKAARSSWNFYKNLRTEDPDLNHDLERASREAYLVATLEMVRQAELRTSGRKPSIFRKSSDTTEDLRLLRRAIETDLKDIGDALPFPLTDAHLFLVDENLAPSERLARLRQTLEANLDEDLARWLPGRMVPAAIAELRIQGWSIDTQFHKDVRRDWYSLIAIAFIEKLKSSPRVATVFESKLLAEIAVREPAASPVATFAGFSSKLDAIMVPLDRIEDQLGVLIRDVAEIKQGLKDVQGTLRQLREDLTGQHMSRVARERNLPDEREERLLAELDQRDQLLRTMVRELGNTREEQAAIRGQLGKVIEERSQLIASIAQRDRSYAAEVAAFRRHIAGLTETRNPALQEALQRFADGDRAGAFPVIEDIVRAENRAAERATAVRSAVKFREVAALALIMKDRGEKTTTDVILLWEEVQRLDPGHHWGWVELTRLHAEAGNLAKSRAAAEKSQDSVGSDRDRSVSLNELGDVLVAGGDLAGARDRFEQSLAIDEKLARDNPSSAAAQRDVSVSLERLGDVLVAGGDLAGARDRFEQSLVIREKLARDNPSSAEAQRDVSVSLNKLGDVLVAGGDLAGARDRFEQSLAIREKLARDNPSSAAAQRDVSVSLERLGDVLVAGGDLAGARDRFEQSLAIRDKLARDNPSSAEAQRDVSVSLNKLGDVLVAGGDLAGARDRFEQSLAIRDKLARDNPSSAEAQRDVSVSLNKLGDVLVAGGDLAGARDRFAQSLEIAGKLARDNPSSAEAQRDVSVSLDRLGDVLVAGEDLAGARDRFEQSLAIREKLARDNPSSAEAQRDVSVSLDRLGDVLVAGEDLAGARDRFEQSLAIREKLARDNPSSAAAQRDVIVSYAKMAGVTNDVTWWQKALTLAEGLERTGRLAPTDTQNMLPILRKAAIGGAGTA